MTALSLSSGCCHWQLSGMGLTVKNRPEMPTKRPAAALSVLLACKMDVTYGNGPKIRAASARHDLPVPALRVPLQDGNLRFAGRWRHRFVDQKIKIERTNCPWH